MHRNAKERRQHAIVVGHLDHTRVIRLANAALERIPEVAEELLSEMDRARIARQDRMPDDVVRMGSTVTVETEEGETRRFTLVYPGAADIAEGRMSILTPLGTALIGLARGQSVRWSARDGRPLVMRILAVEQPRVDTH